MKDHTKDLPGVSPLVYLLIALAMIVTYRELPQGHFQTETDLIRANAARTMAEWIPEINQTSMMINARALAASGTLLPGVWFYHVASVFLTGPSPVGPLLFALLLHFLSSCGLAALAAATAGDRRAAWAGLVFALHPALGDLSAGYINGPAVLSIFWVVQAALFYLRFIRQGAFRQLVASLMCVFLATSSDGIGIFAVFLLVGLEIAHRREGVPLKTAHRVFALGSGVGVALLFPSITTAMGLLSLPARYGPQFGVQRIAEALRYGVGAMVLPSAPGGWLLLFAIGIGCVILLAGVYRSLEEGRRLVPVILFPLALAISLPELSDPASPLPAMAVAYLFPVLCFSWIIGHLLCAINRVTLLTAVLVFTATFMSMRATERLRVPLARGTQVRLAGEELHRIYKKLGEESDIYLIDDGVDSSALIVGHLDFVYRFGLTHQTRFSLVMGGFLFPGHLRSPVGRIGSVMRLKLNRAMTFIGWDQNHEGLVVLDKLIKSRLALAEKVMDAEHRRVEPFSMGGAGAIKAWRPRLGNEPIPPEQSRHYWFIEAPILRLHPAVGRRDTVFFLE